MLKRVSMDKGRGEGKKLGLGGCGGEEGRCEATRLRPSSKSKAGRGSGKVPSTTTSDVYTKMYPGARKSKATAATKCQVSPASLVWKEEGSRQRRRARVPFSPSLPPLPFPSVLSLSTSLTSSAYTHSAYSLLPVQRIQKCLHTGRESPLSLSLSSSPSSLPTTGSHLFPPSFHRLHLRMQKRPAVRCSTYSNSATRKA